MTDSSGSVRRTRRPKVRPVVCLDTGERYPSMAAAAQATGLPVAGIRQAADLGYRCQGTRWAFAEEEPGSPGR